jgi:hypothetical protein
MKYVKKEVISSIIDKTWWISRKFDQKRDFSPGLTPSNPGIEVRRKMFEFDAAKYNYCDKKLSNCSNNRQILTKAFKSEFETLKNHPVISNFEPYKYILYVQSLYTRYDDNCHESIERKMHKSMSRSLFSRDQSRDRNWDRTRKSVRFQFSRSRSREGPVPLARCRSRFSIPGPAREPNL